jgi:hypothetical protein
VPERGDLKTTVQKLNVGGRRGTKIEDEKIDVFFGSKMTPITMICALWRDLQKNGLES